MAAGGRFCLRMGAGAARFECGMVVDVGEDEKIVGEEDVSLL